MSLTGIPLLIAAAVTALVCAVATVLLWSRSGRWRFLVRTVGILLTETALVLTGGFAVNRAEQFYPSWAALAGDTGTTSTTAGARAGDLDTTLAGRTTVEWRPSDLDSWHLAGAPTVTVPPDYLSAGTRRYPVLVALGKESATTVPPAGVVLVALTPTKSTTAAALSSLAADLDRALRVTTGGWAVVAGAKEAALTGQLVRAVPTQFRALAVLESAPAATLKAVGRVPIGTVVALVHPPAAPGRAAPKATAGVTDLAAAAKKEWPAAVTWAAGQLSLPLAPPIQLPASGAR